jgi:hypothetical protein
MFTEFAVAGTVKQGRIELADEAGYRKFVKGLAEGLCVTVTVSEEKDIRTIVANRYLWGVCYRDIEKETGQPRELIHAEMCERFLKQQVVYLDKATGLTVEKWYVGGSSGLSVREFYEFVEKVRLWAAEWLELTIEDPDPEYRRWKASVLKAA